jgi:hypothetical protein
VAGATGYEFVIAKDLGELDPFAIINYSSATTTNGHVAREALNYSTTYNWRVRAVDATGTGAWRTGFFTTAAEPVEAEPAPPPVEIIQQPPAPAPVAPEITLTMPPSDVQDVQVIPETLLWVVVGVGAILVIAVIVLIVRTRRVA